MRKKQFQGFTENDHRLFALVLGTASRLSAWFYLETCRCYGKSSKIALAADRLVEVINLLRALLDNESSTYYPADKLLKEGKR